MYGQPLGMTVEEDMLLTLVAVVKFTPVVVFGMIGFIALLMLDVGIDPEVVPFMLVVDVEFMLIVDVGMALMVDVAFILIVDVEFMVTDGAAVDIAVDDAVAGTDQSVQE